MAAHDKILVAEAQDPPVGVWREITQAQESKEDLDTWLRHIQNNGLSDWRIDESKDWQGKPLYTLMALRRG